MKSGDFGQAPDTRGESCRACDTQLSISIFLGSKEFPPSLDPRHLRGEASGTGPGWRLLRASEGTLTMPPHPVTGCILKVLVLLVTTLHQSLKCVVVEVVVGALLFPVAISARIYSGEAASVILVIKNTVAKSTRIVCLVVANFSRCDAVTTGFGEACGIKRDLGEPEDSTRDKISGMSSPGGARPLIAAWAHYLPW